MESPQSVVSPLKTLPRSSDLDHLATNPSSVSNITDSLGVLEVYIHQARDIQNICIYHKQDVYAKISLTSNPEKSITTGTVNGGGKNPVFNENLQIEIPTIDSSLKFEIYMLSRVRNYLEDQLLGFALIPLSEVVIKNGRLDNEFSLSSNDLFHSPSGFVRLSLSYNGAASPEVITISAPPSPIPVSDQCELDKLVKLEFPDLKVANEIQMMVSEYIGLSDPDDQTSSGSSSVFALETWKPDSPRASVSTNGSQVSVPTETCDTLKSEDSVKTGKGDLTVETCDFSKEVSVFNKCREGVEIELDEKVVQQEFVDLYMKSMKEFTESLAKMNLPLDVENEQTSSGNSSSDQNTRTRVFYGSRAFF